MTGKSTDVGRGGDEKEPARPPVDLLPCFNAGQCTPYIGRLGGVITEAHPLTTALALGGKQSIEERLLYIVLYGSRPTIHLPMGDSNGKTEDVDWRCLLAVEEGRTNKNKPFRRVP